MSTDSEKDIRERAIEGMTTAYLPRETGVVVTLNKVANFLNPWSDEWGEVMTEPGLTADPSVIQALEARLTDPEPSLRAKAARSLGILRGQSAIPALLVVLREDRSNDARFEAARALRKIGDPSVGGELLKLVTYADPKVRNEVVLALGRLRYAPAVPELTRLYVRESAVPPKQMDRTYRERLLGALAFIGDPSSKDLFLREKNRRTCRSRSTPTKGWRASPIPARSSRSRVTGSSRRIRASSRRRPGRCTVSAARSSSPRSWRRSAAAAPTTMRSSTCSSRARTRCPTCSRT